MTSFPQVPVTLAPDGAWTWFNDPRALFKDGVLYFGYMRNSDGKSVLSSYTPGSGSPVELWTSSWNEIDDHDNPALLKRQDGTLMAFYARHAGTSTSLEYRASNNNPSLPSNWGGEQAYNSSERISYANPYQLSLENGRIYHFMRNLNFNPTFITSDDGGASWSPAKMLILTGNASSVRPYVKYCSDAAGRIDFLYTDGHPRDVANSLYHAYYSGNAVYKTDGSLLKTASALPLLHDAGERGSVIYQYSDAATTDPNNHIPGGRAWCWDITYGSGGSPVCVFSVQSDFVTGPNWYNDRIYYYYARWVPGSGWQKRFIAHAGRPLYGSEDDYAGGISIDPADPNVVYLSTNAANPFDLSTLTNVPLNTNERYEIYRGVTTDGGLTFSWQAVTSNSTADNLRPYVPRDHSGYNYALLWMRGTYSSYLSWSTSVQGYFSNSFLNKAPVISLLSPATGSAVLPGTSGRMRLRADVSDDGQPSPVTTQWNLLSGPAAVTFDNATDRDTRATFIQTGKYILRLTASDSELTTTKDVTVHVGNADPTSPALWLKLDESSGTAATDISGNSNHGTLTGSASWQTDAVAGRALRLNGSNSYLNIPDAATLEPGSAFSLSYWFKANSYNTAGAGLVSKRDAPTTNNSFTTFLQGNPLDAAYKKISVDINGNTSRFTSSTQFALGTWYHVTVVYDGTQPAAQRARLYVNGLLDATASEPFTSVPDYPSAIKIGLTHAGASTWFDGAVDDIRFFQRALTDSEISSLAGTLNIAPLVSTGTPPAATSAVPANLSGSVSDDGRGGALTSFWELVSGPGTVVFGNATGASSSATFSRAGSYRLRLSASDTQAETNNELTITVSPNSAVFADFIQEAFPEGTNPALLIPNADPDGDGVSNLTEFALGMNPSLPDAKTHTGLANGLPAWQIPDSGSGFLSFTMRRPKSLLDINYRVEVSGNLGTWSDALLTGPAQDNGNGTETLTYRDTVPMSSATKRFIRLRIEQP
ncbi:MAG: LamG-like jellyroll fold domain-containing protein [Candidatus Methylacidiphilales bacterium]|nr:LamG-like jellyroll fold domain-containing protein [Candidatus Methylacidiphilales bacterium]